MSRERESPEQIGEGGITHIEPAGKRAKGRHHHPHLVRRKTSSADGAAAMGNSSDRMQVAADFTWRAVRQMTERQGPHSQCISKAAPNTICRIRIMIARYPDPFSAALHDVQAFAVACAEPSRTTTVVEAITERYDTARRIVRDQMRQVSQSGRRVIGREQLTPRGKARAFLQMQVSNRQKAVFGPVKGAARIGQ